jgi:hypothetical protein
MDFVDSLEVALYHDWYASHAARQQHTVSLLLCARWRVGVATLVFANFGNRAHRQRLTVGFLFYFARRKGPQIARNSPRGMTARRR